ncbi:predicted protein [Arabidopsis lyrata subsp. lyrata]|uniref:Predicted protein n=1 Tax=Arabidopsis lyrata subsp. lyrata TaxID=81972 RepID=D7LD29_ARALL|nr:predicted protein [Arabidopsis lyrata subsp. lyrata]
MGLCLMGWVSRVGIRQWVGSEIIRIFTTGEGRERRQEQIDDLFAPIERTAAALETDVNTSTLLLIQYLWNEERLVADRQDYERFLGATRPLVPSLEFNVGLVWATFSGGTNDDRKDILETENILTLIKMSTDDLYNFAIKAFKSKATDLVIGGEDLTTKSYSDFVFRFT